MSARTGCTQSALGNGVQYVLFWAFVENSAAAQHNARARAHTPDPQAQEPLSQWTEVWPTQPAYTQAAARAGGRRAGLVSSCVEMQTLPVKRHRGDRDTHTVLALGSLLGIRFGVR